MDDDGGEDPTEIEGGQDAQHADAAPASAVATAVDDPWRAVPRELVDPIGVGWRDVSGEDCNEMESEGGQDALVASAAAAAAVQAQGAVPAPRLAPAPANSAAVVTQRQGTDDRSDGGTTVTEDGDESEEPSPLKRMTGGGQQQQRGEVSRGSAALGLALRRAHAGTDQSMLRA